MVVKTEITIEELTEIATDFLRENYGMELGIPIKRNNRLRRVQGRFHASFTNESQLIDIAGFVFKYGTRDSVIDTLKHELIHYALLERDEPNDDGHPHFEAELRKHGVGSTKSNIIGLRYVAKCTGCGDNTYGRNKRIALPNQRFTSRCCRKPVNYVGERIYNGTEALK